MNHLYIDPNCAIRTELKHDFDTSKVPAANGCKIRFDSNSVTGIGYELFFAYGGGLWYRGEQGGGWKKILSE